MQCLAGCLVAACGGFWYLAWVEFYFFWVLGWFDLLCRALWGKGEEGLGREERGVMCMNGLVLLCLCIFGK